MKRLSCFLTGSFLALLLVILASLLTPSQKRAIWHTLQQVPYLPARYFV
jgi:hypothetical protein